MTSFRDIVLEVNFQFVVHRYLQIYKRYFNFKQANSSDYDFPNEFNKKEMIQPSKYSNQQEFLNQSEKQEDNIDSNRSDSIRLLISAHEKIRELEIQIEELKNKQNQQSNNIIEELNSLVADLEASNLKKDKKISTLQRLNDEMVTNLVNMEKQIHELKHEIKSLVNDQEKQNEKMKTCGGFYEQQFNGRKQLRQEMFDAFYQNQRPDTSQLLQNAKKYIGEQERIIAKRQSTLQNPTFLNQRFLNFHSIEQHAKENRSNMRKSNSMMMLNSSQKHSVNVNEFTEKIKEIGRRYSNNSAPSKQNNYLLSPKNDRRQSPLIKKNNFSLSKSSSRQPFNLISCQNFVNKFEKDLNSAKNSTWKSSNTRSSFKSDFFTKTKDKVLYL